MSIPKVFAFGTGRSGTHTLYNLFASSPATLSFHEGTNPPSKTMRLGDMRGLNLYLHRSPRRDKALDESFVPEGETLEVMSAVFASRQEMIAQCSAQGKAFCDSNRLAYNCINYIYTLYPDARFVHAIRNGYDCVRSWYGRPGAYPTPAMRFLRKARLALIGNEGLRTWMYEARIRLLLRRRHLSPRDMRALADIRNCFMRLEKPVPPRGDAFEGRWKTMDRLERLAWFWSYTNDIIERRMQRIPSDRCMSMHIEDLNEGTARGLLEFCGLQVAEGEKPLDFFGPRSGRTGKVQNTTSRSSSYSLEWTPDKLARFNAIAGPALEKYGYPLRHS